MTLATMALPRPRDVLDEFGIYVHIPFCAHRCWYCDFNAYAGLDHLANGYMDALVRDVADGLSAPAEADIAVRPRVTSVFLGGGTPSLVAARRIAELLGAIRGAWDMSDGVEITIECNPESIDRAKLDVYLGAGVNRISFGVQSLHDELLARLGRTHDAATALMALRSARDAGFTNVSADLIFGIPGEDDRSWRTSIEGILECELSHVSCYALTYEEGTPLNAWKRLGKVIPVQDDDVADRWVAADSLLTSAGLERYEISNWARPGGASKHNTLYWKCGEYLGVGAGAHGHLASRDGAVRSWTLRSPQRYVEAIRAGGRPVAGSEEIDRSTRASEVMLLGLRRTVGVGAATFGSLVGAGVEDVFAGELAHGVDRGVLLWDGETIRVRDPLTSDAAAVLFV
jgi:oxygen-independent coproporphyrinogen-3 oxidase